MLTPLSRHHAATISVGGGDICYSSVFKPKPTITDYTVSHTQKQDHSHCVNRSNSSKKRVCLSFERLANWAVGASLACTPAVVLAKHGWASEQATPPSGAGRARVER